MISLPALVVVGLVAVSWLVDHVARRRDPRADSGAFWARQIAVLGLPLAPLLLVSAWLESLAPHLWASGRHLHADRTGVAGWAPAEVYPWALTTPVALWLVVVGVLLVRAPAPRAAGRWLAGSAGLGRSRAWTLWIALPFAVLVALHADDLGGGVDAYPAASWSSSALFAVLLVAVAASRGRGGTADVSGEIVESASRGQLPDWRTTLEGRGLELSILATTLPSEPPPSLGEGALGRSLERLGERQIAPELVAGLERTIDPLSEATARRGLVLAPDDCGQAETLAAVATLLQRRYLEITIVVVATDAPALAAALGRFHEGPAPAVPTAVEPLPRHPLWVVDAETLSDLVLPRLKSAPEVLASIGLVAWWALHDYSGVLGANLWALSRRLGRLVRGAAGSDPRVVAFVRPTEHAGAQIPDFIRRVLPQDFSGHEIHVPPRIARGLHLYRLGSQERYVARGHGADIRALFRHPLLVAARESAATGWPTWLDTPDEVARGARAAFGELPVGESTLAGVLVASAAEAGASLQPIADGDVVALPERFGAAGRVTDEAEHHLVLAPSANPYVDHLLGRLDDRLRPRPLDGLGGAWRRLVCAEGDERLLRRHLLQALSERPDTREALQRDFRRDDAAIRDTLDRLAATDALRRREVRFLDQRGRLVIDHRFASREAANDSHRPLDTVGSDLIEVIDPAAGHETGGGVRLRVDAERAPLVAYPGRVFGVAGGERVEIQPWSSLAEVRARGFVECRALDAAAVTWRHRIATVHDPVCPMPRISLTVRSGAGTGTAALALLHAEQLIYEERIVGLYVQRARLDDAVLDVERRRFEQPLFAELSTRGLIIVLPSPIERRALVSLCAALEPLIAVHLGVEPDVLGLAPVFRQIARDEVIDGVALIELFPGGIGLLDALHDADRLLVELFARAQAWLDACACGSDVGCPQCLGSARALAASGDTEPRRDEALRLLASLGGGR